MPQGGLDPSTARCPATTARRARQYLLGADGRIFLEAMRMIDRGESVCAATVVGVYRALLEDRGLVAGRMPESADLPFTE